MATSAASGTGPDLTQGVTIAEFGANGLLRGHVGKKAVLLARIGDEVLAVGARCTHYSGPLEDGLVEGDTVRCPWHHASFSLRTGEALAAPAFDPLPRWKVEREGDRIFVHEPAPAVVAGPATAGNERIVIIGGGAAGFAAAEMLRRRGHAGPVTMLSDDADPPCDRPNLSKDFIAGSVPEKWLPLRGADFYAESRIDLQLGTSASAIDTQGRIVTTADGTTHPYDRLLIATGAEPVRPPIPGADQAHVFTLRSVADARAIVARAEGARSAVVLGSGFIGLEVAAALSQRGLAVHVVSLDARPLERVLGPELGDFLRGVHEAHGEVLHMERSIAAIGADRVTLSDGTTLAADLVILGVGVRPRLALAEAAGLALDRGILVNERLETSAPGVYAAGDVARWPADGGTARIEHWVVAERHGQIAAENMMGHAIAYRDTPFFWSVHHDVTLRYVGHGAGWDEVRIDGDIAKRNAKVRYLKAGRPVAMATLGRDLDALKAREAIAQASV